MDDMTAQSVPVKLLKPITEEAFRLLGDETRRKIIFLLRDDELTVKEMASELGLTPQNIYHHIGKLQDAGLVRVVKERRAGHLMESVYTVTADTFVYNEDRIGERGLQSSVDVLNGLNELGIGVEVSEESAVRLSDLHSRRIRILDSSLVENDACTLCSFSGYFMKFGPLNPMLLSRILQYANLVNMSEEEFEESLRLTRELREFLLSIQKEK
ncbi:MAG: winged helix-turn-helix domain-containing protein [Candidatus Bathyarchaeota archaeon]|nr:winged helix-turn-helix domain-containing protein [Candidatus Bathyarchaeota archaeon]